MENTLRYRYIYICKKVCLIDPGFGKLMLTGVGLIKSEWSWCEDNLKMIYSCIQTEDLITFKEIYLKLVKYCRFRNLNPNNDEAIQKPKPYIITDQRPKKGFYLEYKLGDFSVFEIENPKYMSQVSF